jgi:P-type Ca2+ transporter type 2C
MIKDIPKEAWSSSAQEILETMGVSRAHGLTESEVKHQREKFGFNRLRKAKRKSTWRILFEQFKSLIVVLLAVGALVSVAFGEYVDGLAIVVVILLNAAIGFVTELRAVRSMEALRELGSVSARVRREGELREVPAVELVLGDIVSLEGGDVVTADLRLIEASKLQANESALSGESEPVSKGVERVEADAPVAERSSMVFKGTSLTRGSGEGVVVATGMDTELGKISSLVEEAEDASTPLEERSDQLGHRLVRLTLAIIVVVIVVGIVRGKEVLHMIETGVALAVAAVPEGLPIVATIALARGMMRMARRNALVNKLAAVETLGGTTVICTDKTGTLTENQMTVTRLLLDTGQIDVSGEGLDQEGTFARGEGRIQPEKDALLRTMLEVGVLCNNASLPEEGESVGDPVEVALLIAGAKAGIRQRVLLEERPEVREVAFDPDLKMMATFHEVEGDYWVAVKGAPEAVLEACTHITTRGGEREMTLEDREEWFRQNDALAEDGLRVLAAAQKCSESSDQEAYERLSFLGLVGMIDPPREEVGPAIESCRKAGIQVVMVTGDHAITALNVGRAVGLMDGESDGVVHGADLERPDQLDSEQRARILQARILARVSPEQKLHLIALHQDNQAIVAMTGDGVNDAPALKKADIGIAMGQRGTQVAREAADMVLKDDAFSTIVAAVEQGRVIFNNIRKFVLYLVSCNVSEIAVVLLASLVNMPLPITPLQILFLNLVTDVFPALALGVGEGDPDVMERPPRDPKEPILTRRHWSAIGGYGLLITLAVLTSLVMALQWLGMGQQHAVTVSFLTLAFAQLWHVFNMRDPDVGLLQSAVVHNRYVWGALALCTALLLAAVYVPILAGVLRVVDPGVSGWSLVLAMSVAPLAVGQVLKWARILPV